jgi:hypothetical protein
MKTYRADGELLINCTAYFLRGDGRGKGSEGEEDELFHFRVKVKVYGEGILSRFVSTD